MLGGGTQVAWLFPLDTKHSILLDVGLYNTQVPIIVIGLFMIKWELIKRIMIYPLKTF
jgi:hypothetical protein